MDVLRHGAMPELFGGVRAPSTLGRSCARSPAGMPGSWRSAPPVPGLGLILPAGGGPGPWSLAKVPGLGEVDSEDAAAEQGQQQGEQQPLAVTFGQIRYI